MVTCEKTQVSKLLVIESDRLAGLYREYTGQRVCAYQQKMIEGWLLDGLGPSLIEYAIEETAIARAPSWRYLIAIINRCRDSGFYTRESAEANSDPNPYGVARY